MQQFFASVVPGSERVVCDELREFGFSSVRLNRGGIPFRGEWRDGWRACLQSRTAQRIQVLMARFPAPTPEALYDGVAAVDWQAYITHEQTLSVGCVCKSSAITHSGFATLKVKDAIVDQVRKREGERPSVSRDDPDVRVFLYLVADKATLYLDLSGDSLHRRGYRLGAGEAPLKETVAAVMLRLSGWDRKAPLIDPMCGSGTIPIEAAMWAANVAPGLGRGRFGFERWANFGEPEAEELRRLRGELRREVSGQTPRITACDIDADVLDRARGNARAAGVRIAFRERSVLDLAGDGTRRFLVSNPPYGVRLEANREFIEKLSAVITRLHGWRVCFLAGTDAYERAIPLRPRKTHRIPNGALKCTYLVYDVP